MTFSRQVSLLFVAGVLACVMVQTGAVTFAPESASLVKRFSVLMLNCFLAAVQVGAPFAAAVAISAKFVENIANRGNNSSHGANS